MALTKRQWEIVQTALLNLDLDLRSVQYDTIWDVEVSQAPTNREIRELMDCLRAKTELKAFRIEPEKEKACPTSQ